MPPDCTDCRVSSTVYSHNSTTNQVVTTINFGPVPRVNNVSVAAALGFEVGYGTAFHNWCPGSPGSGSWRCFDAAAYCTSTVPFVMMHRTDSFGDLYLTIPAGVSGVRLKVQRTYYYPYSDPGPSTVQLNAATLWSASGCPSGCPTIVTATVRPGDVLSFRERRDMLAIFWIELWEHTRWPTETLATSSVVHIAGRLCTTCPTNYSGPTCLPTPTDIAPPPPPAPPPPASFKQVSALCRAAAPHHRQGDR